MNKTTNKDLTDFGRREAGVCIVNNGLGWGEVVSARRRVENESMLYGNPTRDNIIKAYIDFVEKLNNLGG
jgi:hypothetical protein